MKITIRINAPSRWKKNYLVEALKKSGIRGEYTRRKINPRTEVLITNYLSNNELKNLSNLKVLIIPTSGTEKIDLKAVKKKGILIHQDKSRISQGVVQYFLDKVRKMSGVPLDKYFLGKNVGLLGFGNIGRRIYFALKNYDCKFWIIKKRPFNPSKKIVYCSSLNGIDKVLRSCDIIINTLPLSKETKGIGFNKTKLIKNGAVVINLSRSGILEEKEILDRVKEGTLKGAIFDVYPKGLDLRSYVKVSNIILTPHIAAIYKNNLKKILQKIKEWLDDLQIK